MTTLSTKSTHYLEAAKAALGKKGWETSLLKTFEEAGLPTKKNENYKYTNLESALFESLSLSPSTREDSEELQKLINEVPGKNKLVFINGVFKKDLSLIKEDFSVSERTSPIDLSSTADLFDGLTQSLTESTLELTFKKNTKYGLTTLLFFLNQEERESAFHSIQVTAETGSEVNLLEILQGGNETESQSFSYTQINVESNANFQHARAYLANEKHNHIGKVQGELARDAQFYSLSFMASGLVTRNNLEINVNGEGAHATVNGLYAARGNQHPDSFTHIHHKAAHTTSEQLFKGILDDQSHGIFTGKIVIHRDAQQVDSSQLNKNLLLSKKAHVDTRPQIEVYADDVKCGHGATVGQINQEEVFYLESRGIPKNQAQKILCHAFGQEVIDSHPDSEVGAFLGRKLFEEFEKFALENLEEKLEEKKDA